MTRGLRRSAEGLLALGVLVLAVGWLSGACETRVSPGTVEVPAAEAAGGTTAEVEEVVEPAFEWASGEVASARQIAVSSRVLARIDEVRVRAGSSVQEGDVLVRLDARDVKARVGEMQQALRSAEARLELARRQHARAQELFRSGVASSRQLDEATSELHAAEADVAGRKQALEEARAGASFTEIRAPSSGRVVDRLAEPGDTAVPGRPLLRIYDPSLLRVEAPVRESLAVKLHVGQDLRVEVPALDQTVTGKIDEIVPFAEPGARTLLVKVRLPRSDARLFAGMYARIAVPAGEQRRLLIPQAAVDRVGQLEFATAVGSEGRAERRAITTGEPAGDGRIEVLSGLRAGERVQVPVPDQSEPSAASSASKAA